MDVYCDGSNCKKKNECALHMTLEPNKVYQNIDYSNYGSGRYSDHECEVSTWCGDEGNYERFVPIKPIDHVDTVGERVDKLNDHLKVELKKIREISHDSFSLIQCANCKSHGIEITLDENDYLKIECQWCGVTSRIKLSDNNSILKYKRAWNALHAYLECILDYHKRGLISTNTVECNINEHACSELLTMMTDIENSYKS